MAAKKTTRRKPSAAKKSTKKAPAHKQTPKARLNPQIKALLYGAAAVLLCCFIVIPGENVWTAIRNFIFGLFGLCSVLLPVMFVYLAIITAKEKQVAHSSVKAVLILAILLFANAAIYLFAMNKYVNLNYFSALQSLFVDSASAGSYFASGGGLVSGILGYPLMLAFGQIGASVVTIVVLLTLICVIARVSILDIGKAAHRVGEQVSRVYEKSGEYLQQAHQRAVERKEQRTAKQNRDSVIDIPLDNGVRKIKPSDRIDIALDNEGTAVKPTPKEDLLNIVEIANKDIKEQNTVSALANSIINEKKKPKKTKGAKQPDPQTVPVSEDFLESEQRDTDAYKFPPVELLKPDFSSNDEHAMNEMQNNAAKLVETLKSFGVEASIINICRGPSVTRYELQPAPGVKISKITNLSDDIALNLAANGVRIEAPIPGKAAVGIEVPNKVVSMVTMRELIDSDEFRRGKSRLTCVLGKDISGSIVVTDLAKMPHLLIAGTTGSGKSVCVNSILLSILYKATPDEVKLLLIDPKMVEFSKYKGIPHLLVPVVSDAKKAAGALNWAVSEMLQRYKIFSEYDCKDIHSYNKLVDENLKYIEEHPPECNEEGEEYQPVMEVNGLPVAKEKLPQIVIAIDELADLMMAAPGEVEESICRLAQMARAAGMHLVIATQRPSVNVITGVIKANIPSRISLKVSSNVDSRTILDFGGAEKLIGKGDMLFAPVGAPKPLRVQGCYASDEEIESVTKYIKKSYEARYNAEIEEKIKKIAAEDINGSKDSASQNDGGIEVDDKMEEAIQCVIEAGQASTSLLQRRLKVGYARAGRMIDDMEQMGIVGPHQGSKPRDVLLTYNEWLERNHLLGGDASGYDGGFTEDDD